MQAARTHTVRVRGCGGGEGEGRMARVVSAVGLWRGTEVWIVVVEEWWPQRSGRLRTGPRHNSQGEPHRSNTSNSGKLFFL